MSKMNWNRARRSYSDRPVELVDVPVEVVGETALAWKVDAGGLEPIWLPKSQVEITDGIAAMPEWLANRHGLI